MSAFLLIWMLSQPPPHLVMQASEPTTFEFHVQIDPKFRTIPAKGCYIVVAIEPPSERDCSIYDDSCGPTYYYVPAVCPPEEKP